MAYDIDQMRRSRSRLKKALDEIQLEINWLDSEIKKAINETPLNDNFFWSKVFPLLESKPKGISSSDMQSMLRTFGSPVNSNAFSTFLSRNKARGRLILDNSMTPPRWRLASDLVSPLAEEN